MTIEVAIRNLVEAFREENAIVKSISVDEAGIRVMNKILGDVKRYKGDVTPKARLNYYASVEIREDN